VSYPFLGGPPKEKSLPNQTRQGIYSLIPQVIVNSLVIAAVLAIVGLGLTMCFDILKFSNFAHTELAVTGA
jgi:hypothetical protein